MRSYLQSVKIFSAGVLLWVARVFFAPELNAAETEEDERLSLAVEAVSRLKGTDLEANPSVKAAVFRLLEKTQSTPYFIQVVRDFGFTNYNAELLRTALRNPAEPLSLDALRIIFSSGETNLLEQSLQSTNIYEASRTAQLLGLLGEKHVLRLLWPVLLASNRPLDVRQETVKALAQMSEGAEMLLERAERGSLPKELHNFALKQLMETRWQPLKQRASQLATGIGPGPPAVFPPISELLRQQGHSGRGATVYSRQDVGCINCHQVAGIGVSFGPDLSEIGTKLGKDALYQSILEPNAGISFGYESWLVEFNTGDVIDGIVVSETEDELVIKDPRGVQHRYEKKTVRKKERLSTSAMPSGLQQSMSVQDLVDLVEYLSTLKKNS